MSHLAPTARSTLALAFALCACAGSGDTSSYEIAVSYSRSPLIGISFDDTPRTNTCVTATLDPKPTEAPAVLLSDDGGTFVPGDVSVTSLSDGSFQACLPIQAKLAPGVHTGNLTLRICKDSTCSRQYTLSKPVLPYQVTVYHVVAGLPPLTAEVLVDGAVPAGITEGLSGTERTYAVSVRSGQTILVTPSTAYVTASVSQVLVPLTGAADAMVVRAQIASGATTSSGYVELRATDGRRVSVNVTISP